MNLRSLPVFALALAVTFTACKKEAGMPKFPTQTGKANTVDIQNNQVIIKLVGLEGFSDPCFNMSFDEVAQESFRFTGGYTLWNYSSLASGLHSFSFTCLHECTHENGSELMRFEIDDGKRYQEVSARETDHCKYEFWLNVK